MSNAWENNYRRGMQLDDDELAELAELNTPPMPEFHPQHMGAAILGGLAGWAILAGIVYVAYLAWQRV